MIEHPNNSTQEKIRLHFYIPVILYMTILAWIPNVLAAEVSTDRVPYTIVDTAQIRCYSNNAEIQYPKAHANFFGQDAQYIGNEPAYKDNGAGQGDRCVIRIGTCNATRICVQWFSRELTSSIKRTKICLGWGISDSNITAIKSGIGILRLSH